MKEVVVLTRRYLDGSGFTAIRVYEDPNMADSDLALLESHGDSGQKYNKHKVDFVAAVKPAFIEVEPKR